MELFISIQDPRQRPKGTRDSLGFEQIWTLYGRKIISGITTITSSLDNFIIALLGFYLSEENTNNENSQEKAHFFIRYEQLMAYLRLEKNPNSNVLGISRAKKNMLDGNESLSITNQILSSQLSYGLWGLYSSALADVGLIKNRVPTKQAEEIIGSIKKKYPSLIKYIVEKSKDEHFGKLRYEKHSDSLAEILNNEDIKNKMLEILLQKSSLYQYVLNDTYRTYDGKIKYIKELIEDILNTSNDENLLNDIRDIEKIDLVMLVANKLFNAIRHSNYDGQSLDNFVEHISDINFPSPLTLPVRKEKLRSKVELEHFVNYLNTKQYKEAIKILLQINVNIMKERNSIPWVEINEDILKIRVKTSDTIEKDEQFKGMEYNYFIYSYLGIATNLKTDDE
jgi:hypothetical protein